MPRKSRFKVTRVAYRSGSTAYRVSGTLNGKQIRENFKPRKEAYAERQELDIQRLNSQHEGCYRWVELSPEELDAAVAAAKRVRGTGKQLSDAVDFYLEPYQKPEDAKSLSVAVNEYVDEKSSEHERGLISFRQCRGIRSELRRFTDILSITTSPT